MGYANGTQKTSELTNVLILYYFLDHLRNKATLNNFMIRYSEMARKQGLIGMASTNTSPWVAPTRSSVPIFGTNPICVAAPGEKENDSFLLDMSTSSVALGKIEMQVRKDEPLPSHSWALGKDGAPTTNAKEAFFEGKGIQNRN